MVPPAPGDDRPRVPRSGQLAALARARRELVDHLVRDVCEPGGRLIVGPANEAAGAWATAELVEAWGYEVAGRAERPKNERVARRVFWIESG